MEPAKQYFINQPKSTQKDHDFTFLVDFTAPSIFGNKHIREQGYRNEFLGIPNLPVIGKYSNKGYEFCRIISSAIWDLNLTANEKDLIYEIDNKIYSDSFLKLPSEIIQILTYDQKDFPKNQRIDDDDDSENLPKNKKQTKLTSYYKAETKSSTNKVVIQPNPSLFGVTNKVKFKWCIFENTLLDIKLKFDNDPNGLKTYNIVPHPWLFPAFDFSKIRRMVHYTPMCVVIPQDIINSCGVAQFIEGEKSKAKHFNGINFNQLRMEYTSAHLRGPSLCFSPNNLRLMVDEKEPISHFWLIIFDEIKMHNFAYYFWFINDKTISELIENCSQVSNNLNELLSNLEKVLGKDNEPLNHIKNILC